MNCGDISLDAKYSLTEEYNLNDIIYIVLLSNQRQLNLLLSIQMSKYTYYTVFSDSLFRFTFQSLHSMNIDHPYILNTVYNYNYVSNQGKLVNVCWILSHIGIHGNNESDKAAKSTLEFEIVQVKIPSKDLKLYNYKLCLPDILGLLIQVNYILFKIKSTYHIILILNTVT